MTLIVVVSPLPLGVGAVQPMVASLAYWKLKLPFVPTCPPVSYGMAAYPSTRIRPRCGSPAGGQAFLIFMATGDSGMGHTSGERAGGDWHTMASRVVAGPAEEARVMMVGQVTAVSVADQRTCPLRDGPSWCRPWPACLAPAALCLSRPWATPGCVLREGVPAAGAARRPAGPFTTWARRARWPAGPVPPGQP
jgi:hypothetical protein